MTSERILLQSSRLNRIHRMNAVDMGDRSAVVGRAIMSRRG